MRAAARIPRLLPALLLSFLVAHPSLAHASASRVDPSGLQAGSHGSHGSHGARAQLGLAHVGLADIDRASGPTNRYLETRIRAFDVIGAAGIGVDASPSPCELWGYEAWWVGPASGKHDALLVHNACPPVRSRHYSESAEGIRLHEETKAFRARHAGGKDPYRNYATADVAIDGEARTVHFKNDPGGMHSEQRLVAWVERMKGRGRDVTVKRVYTERPPCGPMSMNCGDTLANQFGPSLEVFHSQRPKRFRR